MKVFWLLIEDQFFPEWHGPMPLNEVGDFLAGSFSPLAFAWLAYGYWMQNKELKNTNYQANKAHEVSLNQIDFQKNAKNHDLIKEHNKLQPIFSFKVEDLELEKLNLENKIYFKITNIGYNAKNLRISQIINLQDEKYPYTENNEVEMLLEIQPILDNKDVIECSANIYNRETDHIQLSIKYFDGLINEQEIFYEIYIFKSNNMCYFKVIEDTSTKELPEVV